MPIAQHHHRDLRPRADLRHLIHRLQYRHRRFVIDVNDDVINTEPRIGGRAVRGNFGHDDPLQAIDAGRRGAHRDNLFALNTKVAADHPAITDQLIHDLGCQFYRDGKA
ncbi:hypothetical protein D3C77_642480 [compost metagenome]